MKKQPLVALAICIITFTIIFSYNAYSQSILDLIIPKNVSSEPNELDSDGIYKITLKYLGDFIVTIILSAVIAYHPSIIKKCDTVKEYELPKTVITYGLIGMVVGFLVQSGNPVIGFVIFGIGGLVRFRSEIGDSKDTGRVILCTLHGLCVGMNMPIAAAISTLTFWIVLFQLERRCIFVLQIKSEDEKEHELNVKIIQEPLENIFGAKIIKLNHASNKNLTEIVFRTDKYVENSNILDKMSKLVEKEKIIHLEIK